MSEFVRRRLRPAKSSIASASRRRSLRCRMRSWSRWRRSPGSVLHELAEHEVTEVVGTKGHHDADRAAKRHGHTPGEVTLGGRRLPVSRPRVRSQDGAAEIGLESYVHFVLRDLLAGVVLERMLAARSDAPATTTLPSTSSTAVYDASASPCARAGSANPGVPVPGRSVGAAGAHDGWSWSRSCAGRGGRALTTAQPRGAARR